MINYTSLLLAFPYAILISQETSPNDSMHSLLEKAQQNQESIEKSQSQYVCHAKFTSSLFDSNKQKVKELVRRDFTVTPQRGTLIWMLDAINGQPPSSQERARNTEEINESIKSNVTKRRTPSLNDIIEMCDISFDKSQCKDGLMALSFKPKIGITSKTMLQAIVASSIGRILIEKDSGHIAEISGTVTSSPKCASPNIRPWPIGTTYQFEQAKCVEGVWLPKKDIILLPSSNPKPPQTYIEGKTEFSDFKKCTVENITIEKQS